MSNVTEACTCKKCHRPLPDGYKYKKCESCRNHASQKFKTGLTVAGGIVASAASVVVVIVTKGKVKPKE